MKTTTQILLLLSTAIALGGCAASQSKKPAASNKNLKLETIDHGPGRPKTYLFREVDPPANR